MRGPLTRGHLKIPMVLPRREKTLEHRSSSLLALDAKRVRTHKLIMRVPLIRGPLNKSLCFFVPRMREASQEIKDWKTVRLPAGNLKNCPQVVLWLTPSPPTKSFPTKSPWVKLSGRLPTKSNEHENSHPWELRVCLSQTLWNPNS